MKALVSIVLVFFVQSATVAVSGTFLPQSELVVEERFSGSFYYDNGRCFDGVCELIATVQIYTDDDWSNAQFIYAAVERGRGPYRLVGGYFNFDYAAKSDSNYAAVYGDYRNDFGSYFVGSPLSFLLGGDSVSAWDILSGGLRIQQSFFGNEFKHRAIITLKNKERRAYEFTLWDLSNPHPAPPSESVPATTPVPLPQSIFAMVPVMISMVFWSGSRSARLKRKMKIEATAG